MASQRLIPQPFWFRYAFACPRIQPPSRATRRPNLLDLPESCRLPAMGELDGQGSWADVRVGWNPAGLGVSILVAESSRVWSRAADADGDPESVEVWIDTRDTRDVHRATRFCHRFAVQVQPDRGESLRTDVSQKQIARALADAPRASLKSVQSQATAVGKRGGWRVELFLAADALHGFDPDVNRRLGFMLRVADPERGDQYLLGLGREFPIGEDPSLWATLELKTDGP